MLEELLVQEEGKTLEFKESTQSLQSIVKTIIAFANTAGGIVVIGVKDKKKEVIGISNVLLEEERLANVIAESIVPLLIPDIQIQSFRNRELIVIQVPHAVGPFYLKSAGLERGVYVRLGSTSRIADSEIILSLQMLARNLTFDELPCQGASLSDIDESLIDRQLTPKLGDITQLQYQSLGILTKHPAKPIPTNGSILLFANNRIEWFPDSVIRCVRFSGDNRADIIDQLDITASLIAAADEVIMFIRRHTKNAAKIGHVKREDIPEYPPQALREAVINSIVHADYALKGSAIQVAIFSDRIEITNPGGLTYGQTIKLALAGVSRMRNRMMGRIFREIELIEQLGTGIQRVINIYQQLGGKPPQFEDLGTHFRVTLYSADLKQQPLLVWQKDLLALLTMGQRLGTAEIAKIWKVTTRTARSRLSEMIVLGLIERVGTSAKDPHAQFKVACK